MNNVYPVYTMKQTWSKLRAHVVHVYRLLNTFALCLLHVGYAFLCKRGITVDTNHLTGAIGTNIQKGTQQKTALEKKSWNSRNIQN